MKAIKYILVALLSFPSILSCGDYSDPLRVAEWQILYRQDESIENILKAEGWSPVEMPATFVAPYKKADGFCFVWLKGEFNISGDPAEYYGLSTGRIKYADEIYVNGILIGSTSSDKVNWFALPRNYQIPEDTLKKRANRVYIRLGLYKKYHGGILSDIYVMKENDFERTLFISNLLYRQIPIGIVVLFACFSIILFIGFLLDRKEKISLYSLLPLLVSIAYIFLPLSSYRLISFELYSAMQFSLVPLFSVLFIILFQSFYRVYLTNFNWFIIPSLLLVVVIIILFRNAPYSKVLSFTLVIFSLLIIIPFSIYMIIRLNSIHPDRFLLILTSIMGAIALTIMILETYFAYIGARYSELSEIFVPPVFIVLGTILTSREIVKRKRELESVYEKLEKLEGKEISITETVEVKLNRLIEFINENYTSDLSREGMAAAIGIHPNYLGRLFKIHTGKKINDYINYVRIKEAVRRLEGEEDVKIIDIAFSVGFESLATFNRVFKIVMGKTPSDYR